MLHAIRRHITPATVIATLALVFAITGGAYAANHFLITSTKQISPKVLKTLKGASGAAGAPGAAGPAGPAGLQGPGGSQGPAGPGGPQGPKGETGTPGTPGKDGKDGKDGTTGFTETLPEGKTETGNWSVGHASEEDVGQIKAVALSFNIPLASELTEVIYVEAGHTGVAGCGGTVEAPAADPGKLCVYALVEENTGFLPTAGFPFPDRAGALLGFISSVKNGWAAGTWAVTAPTAP